MILVDVNVFMDVFYRREPYFAASAALIDRVAQRRRSACIAAHGLTNLHYLVQRYINREAARTTVDWVLRTFEIAAVGPKELTRAHALNWSDFEDAVVAAAAESAGCKAIVTRNAKDFRGSPVPAMPPEELVIDEIHESFVKGYASGSK